MVTPRISGKNYQRKSAKSAGGYLDANGNVMAVVSDRKTLSPDSIYIPDVISYTDYYPFGFPIERRSWDLGDYQYGFNGQESDGEAYGQGGLAGYEFRQYDTRLGRWWGVDPEVTKFPSESPFLFCGGNPILYLDKYGRYKLPKNEARKSAMFAKYLNSYMKKDVLNSSNIMRGLQLYGELSVAEIEELLTHRKGPEIYIVDGSAIRNAGWAFPEERPNIIYINQKNIDIFNAADENLRQAALLLVISTLLHGTVHYGDFQHGGYEDDNQESLIQGYKEGYPVYKSIEIDEKGQVFESDVYFYEGVYNMEEYWTQTIDDLQDAIEVVKEKSKTEEGRKDLPTVPEP